MAQDLRKLFEEERSKKKFKMKEGHEDRFLERLEKNLPVKKKSYNYRWLGIVASVAIMLGVGTYFFLSPQNSNPTTKTTIVDTSENQNTETGISLGDLSPDLQKLENYYTANINLELASLEISDENKELVDGYLEQLAELNEEYQNLNHELNDIGPNDETITALIKNLQLRLQLLQKLKTKLNQFKSSKNEQQATII
ncbi:hypothetical protein [Allomuricauda sp. d1]|uniref:hypothetical protein n=1 Tax=Allomuricauda sp. d1 TaxID=3136725 RepID=UPI0031D642CD